MENKYKIFNGYELIGEANSINEAKQICNNYCEKHGIIFELKRELNSYDITVLIFQYRTLYLETFVITKGYEIEKRF